MFLPALAFLLAPAAAAIPETAPQLTAPLADISFLVGRWTADDGKVPDIGATSTGRSEVTAEAGGRALLRRDHVDLFVGGKPRGGLDQIMLIYPEDGTLHADYSDGTHVIHYDRATVTPGRSVVFASPPRAGAPAYRLRYALSAPGVMAVSFSASPTADGTFALIASGTLRKAAG